MTTGAIDALPPAAAKRVVERSVRGSTLQEVGAMKDLNSWRAAAAAAVLTAAWGSGASAAPPGAAGPHPNPPQDAGVTATFGYPDANNDPNDLSFPAVCPFPVTAVFSGKSKAVQLPGGLTLHTSPGLKVTLTNDQTGQQVTLNITGAVRGMETASGFLVVKATGRNLLFDARPGQQSIKLVIGDFSYALNAYPGLVTEAPQGGHGRIIDVCPLIAPAQ